MSYEVIQKPAFLNDFIGLPRTLQRRVAKAIEDLRENAESPRGDTIKKMGHGYQSVWRYRLGDWRLVYAANGAFVQLLGVGARKDIYARFYSSVDLPPEGSYPAAVEELLSLEKARLPDWVEGVLEITAMSRRSHSDSDQLLPEELTRDKLTRWRVPLQYHAALMACRTEGDLLRCEVPSECATQVLEQLYPRPAEQVAEQPNLLLSDPTDLIRYADGDLLGFLLKLDTEQDRYVDWALDGPTLVKGGPGSGKSTVALYRARELVVRGATTVLFTTYTNALVEYSRQLLQQLMGTLPAQMQVCTLDSIAVQIVEQCDGRHLNIRSSNEIKAALSAAQARFSQDPDSKYEQMLLTDSIQGIGKQYLVQEIEWVIEGRDLRSIEEYVNTDRTGRSHRFDDRTRQAMWRIYQYAKGFLEDRKFVTWGNVRSRALELVQSGKWSKRWDAVIVDEAQDLTPTALALCIELCRDPRGLFLTADASQSLYNRGFRWADVHEKLRVVGRTRILKRNYRSTMQIAKAATEILRNTEAGDEEVLDQTYVHSGPRPAIHVCEDNDEILMCLTVEIQEAARELRLPVSAAAVLVPTHQLAEETAKALSAWGLPARFMTSRELELRCPQIKVLTIHSAKGLEFPIVVLPYVEENILPRLLEGAQAEDLNQHLCAERRLFFVGCTRAMRRLVVTSRKGHCSSFLDSLGHDAWRWE